MLGKPKTGKTTFCKLLAKKIDAETSMQTELAGGVLLQARVDACVFAEVANLVINFKTGTPPNKIEVTSGYAPQLLVETFLYHSAYPGTSTQGEFWQLKGTQPPGMTTSSVAMPLELIRENLTKITNHYLMQPKPFLACPWPLKKPKYNDYVYLERLNNA